MIGGHGQLQQVAEGGRRQDGRLGQTPAPPLLRETRDPVTDGVQRRQLVQTEQHRVHNHCPAGGGGRAGGVGARVSTTHEECRGHGTRGVI